MVIVALPSMGNGGLNEMFSQRFGRCEAFTFVTVEDNNIKEVKAVGNAGASAMGGAGIQAAQLIGNNGATEVIAGFLGPNASQSLNALKILIYQAPNEQLTVKQAMDLYLENKLQKIDSANVGSHYGMGGGMGGGRGIGGGRGMGGGQRRSF